VIGVFLRIPGMAYRDEGGQSMRINRNKLKNLLKKHNITDYQDFMDYIVIKGDSVLNVAEELILLGFEELHSHGVVTIPVEGKDRE